MASPTSPVSVEFFQAEDFPDRDSLINFLVTTCGWSTAKVAQLMELSTRQVRRIAYDGPAWAPMARDEPAPLTKREAETMLRDYQSDPYVTPEERELAMSWMTSIAQASGVQELSRIKFRHGIRPAAKPRNAWGTHSR